MNGKGVSVLLGVLYPVLLCLLHLLLVGFLLHGNFSWTVRWDFMTGRDGCVN